jgi:hypothetical protein
MRGSKDLFPIALPRIWPAFLLPLAGSVALFVYGINVPFDFRVRGDAYQYLMIAKGFGSLTEAFFHIGERSNGFPFFEYLLRLNDLQSWSVLIATVLFAFHLLASFWLCQKTVEKGWIVRNSFWHWLLGSLLLTYPALVLYTTTPVTDTFGTDLVIMAFCCLDAKGRRWMPIVGGITLAYAVTVRPAYELGSAVALAAYGVTILARRNRAKKKTGFWRSLAPVAPGLAALLFLAPTLVLCYSQFGVISVQDPATFAPVRHAQMGLKGGRLLWFRPELATGDEFPVLADPFLQRHFYDPCKLDSILGFNDSSLSGCLGARPFSSVVYLGKKWIGLFDQFQLQPYAENLTPSWYTWLSRVFAALALWGQFVFLGFGLSWGLSWFRKTAVAPDPTLTAVFVFCAVTTFAHLLLHVENRFSLVWIPYSLAALVWGLSHLRSASPLKRAAFLAAGLSCVALYFVQVLAWDSLSGPLGGM